MIYIFDISGTLFFVFTSSARENSESFVCMPINFQPLARGPWLFYFHSRVVLLTDFICRSCECFFSLPSVSLLNLQMDSFFFFFFFNLNFNTSSTSSLKCPLDQISAAILRGLICAQVSQSLMSTTRDMALCKDQSFVRERQTFSAAKKKGDICGQSPPVKSIGFSACICLVPLHVQIFCTFDF